MSNLAYFGFLSCAAVYAAIGLIGVVLLSTSPDIPGVSDGYGTIRVVAQK